MATRPYRTADFLPSDQINWDTQTIVLIVNG